ncbi:hypothetical protein M2G93_16925 [Vibrio vulnificus]|uniref:hypothetical protein n=1 Tax=Vibrio vulnificus TaxID=672 RepID=UPI0021DA84B8|nr:DUF1173 domain-containing protein [Vibrio vulnificus]EHD1698091.1 DUF1173 domain-containing protein [Vibrio vulnificus]EKZ9225821.1 DUF1173 family protein [Vibrio vulnificus]ELC9582662.1 DUF1173 family protein [Vibrio vulnificus]MCU8149800.1 hypothetical protein [Vibrio vulnificus]
MWKLIRKSNGEYAGKIASTSLFVQNCRHEEESQRRLRDIYESEQWIECCCRSQGYALMFVRKLESGLFTLVNHPIKGRHTSECPFYSDISEKIDDHEWGGNVEGNEILTFCLHNEITTNPVRKPTASISEPSTAKTKKGTTPKIGRLLYQLMSDGFLNSHFPQKRWNRDECLYQLKQSASKITFGSMSLDNVIYFGNKGLDWATSRLLGFSSNKERKWEGAGRPHAFLLEVVSNITSLTTTMIEVDGRQLKYRNVIKPKLRETKAPALLFSSLVLDESTNDVIRHTCFVQPVVDVDCLIPVDSGYEREFAALAISMCDATSLSKISFTKPLTAIRANTGELLLPDFLFSLKHPLSKQLRLRCIVEVMGFDDEQYLTRKAHLHPLMARCFGADRLYDVKGSDSAEMRAVLMAISQA